MSKTFKQKILPTNTIIRVTGPDGTQVVGPLGHFNREFLSLQHKSVMLEILHQLKKDGYCVLYHPGKPGQDIRIEIVGKEQAN